MLENFTIRVKIGHDRLSSKGCTTSFSQYIYERVGMFMEKAELAKKIFEMSYLNGEFKLRSGEISSEYFDKYQFESDPMMMLSA